MVITSNMFDYTLRCITFCHQQLTSPRRYYEVISCSFSSNLFRKKAIQMLSSHFFFRILTSSLEININEASKIESGSQPSRPWPVSLGLRYKDAQTRRKDLINYLHRNDVFRIPTAIRSQRFDAKRTRWYGFNPISLTYLFSHPLTYFSNHFLTLEM